MTDEQPSEKQIKYAMFLKIENPSSCSKAELRKLIDEKLNEDESKPKEEVKTSQSGSKQELSCSTRSGTYHLTPEQVRSNALNCAILVKDKFYKNQDMDLMGLAKTFEAYINGL